MSFVAAIMVCCTVVKVISCCVVTPPIKMLVSFEVTSVLTPFVVSMSACFVEVTSVVKMLVCASVSICVVVSSAAVVDT